MPTTQSKNLTAEQKRAALAAGASVLLASATAFRPTAIEATGAAKYIARLKNATNPALLNALIVDEPEQEGDDVAPAYRLLQNGIAYLPIFGVMVDEPPAWWLPYLGATSIPQLIEWAGKAKADANVQRVFLHVKSPGGDYTGQATLAETLFQISSSGKTVWAMCEQACSGGYFAASQADRVFAQSDGDIGSIGARSLLYDYSAAFAAEGVRAIPVTSSGAEEYKAAGAMGTVITPAQEANFKRYADEAQATFTQAVARGRGVSIEKAQEWADGRYFLGYVAKPMGLVDEIGEPAEILAQLGVEVTITKDPPPADTDAVEFEALRRKNNYASKTQGGSTSRKGKSTMHPTLAAIARALNLPVDGTTEEAPATTGAATLSGTTPLTPQRSARETELETQLATFRQKETDARAAKASAFALNLAQTGKIEPTEQADIATKYGQRLEHDANHGTDFAADYEARWENAPAPHAVMLTEGVPDSATGAGLANLAGMTIVTAGGAFSAPADKNDPTGAKAAAASTKAAEEARKAKVGKN